MSSFDAPCACQLATKQRHSLRCARDGNRSTLFVSSSLARLGFQRLIKLRAQNREPSFGLRPSREADETSGMPCSSTGKGILLEEEHVTPSFLLREMVRN